MNFKRNKFLILLTLILFVVFGIFVIYQVIYTNRAHETFENYYAFRGCTQLLTKTDNDATCKLADGKVIKIVKFQNKWYLDGDLPCGFLCW